MAEQTQEERMKNIFAGESVLQGSRKTTTVSIDLTDIDEDYVGKFKFHYPSLMEKMKIGLDEARMLDGLPRGSVDVETDNIAYLTATLMNVVDYAPDWFKLDVIGDYRVLDRVYRRYAEWRDSFRKSDKGSKSGKTGRRSKHAASSVGNGQVEGSSD